MHAAAAQHDAAAQHAAAAQAAVPMAAADQQQQRAAQADAQAAAAAQAVHAATAQTVAAQEQREQPKPRARRMLLETTAAAGAGGGGGAAVVAKAAVVGAAGDAGGGGAAQAAVAAAAGGAVAVRHPCLFDGYTAAYTRQVNNGSAPTPAAVTLVGEPHWDACVALAASVLADLAPPCRRPPCVLGVPQPPLRGRFMALTGFAVVWSYLKLPVSATPADVVSAARAYCAVPAARAAALYGDKINYERYCLWGPYVAALLGGEGGGGLGLAADAVAIGGRDVGWPLGAAIYEGLHFLQQTNGGAPRIADFGGEEEGEEGGEDDGGADGADGAAPPRGGALWLPLRLLRAASRSLPFVIISLFAALAAMAWLVSALCGGGGAGGARVRGLISVGGRRGGRRVPSVGGLKNLL
jgi:hypothetical protein